MTDGVGASRQLLRLGAEVLPVQVPGPAEAAARVRGALPDCPNHAHMPPKRKGVGGRKCFKP